MSASRAATRLALDASKRDLFRALVRTILPHNRFYAEKFGVSADGMPDLDGIAGLPLTTKADLVAAAADAGRPGNLTWPVDRYVRYHQTSGTRGRPLPVYDTADDWRWWMACWSAILERGRVGPGDRVVVASSFGPYAGFWSGFDGVVSRGGLAVPAGGMSSLGRLELIRSVAATVLLTTPSYALHLAEVAAEAKIDTAALPIRLVIVAGEPGGSVPSVRRRIAAAWEADVLDHAGATEIGPWGVGDLDGPGLDVLEPWFHPEFLAVDTGAPARPGELAELVITTLGRSGAPLIRYRTGDLVRPRWPDDDAACPWVRLEGGVVGRADDMLVIRGVNVFPSAIDDIVRGFPEVSEYRITVSTRESLDELALEIEDHLNDPTRVARELQVRLGLRVDVSVVPSGSLPRFEGKGRRFVDRRPSRSPS